MILIFQNTFSCFYIIIQVFYKVYTLQTKILTIPESESPVFPFL